MKYLNLCFLFLVLITLISCKDQDNEISNPVLLECDKLTSRESAENLMNQVNDDSFTDSSSIIANLIGEWGLIGMVPGWVGFESGQECIRLTIDSNKIELEDLNSGNNSSSEWELKVVEVNNYRGFYLETNEDVWTKRMGMETFSENIMFGTGRVDDGNTYIYEKLE